MVWLKGFEAVSSRMVPAAVMMNCIAGSAVDLGPEVVADDDPESEQTPPSPPRRRFK